MSEKRKHLRLPVASTTFIELESPTLKENSQGTVVKCRTLNVSRGGLLVLLDREVPVGAILQIGVDLADGDQTLYLAAEVRWCAPAEESGMRRDGWYAGFQVLNSEGSDVTRWIELITSME
ncbi:MAG: PilZ domain-containing protein [Halioglobus sp.]|nr:PilZ domain-containing protein [Halioglobus sp.]